MALFTNLPVELCLSILRYADIATLSAFSQISRLYNEMVIKNAAVVWKSALLNTKRAKALEIMAKKMDIITERLKPFPFSEEFIQYLNDYNQQPFYTPLRRQYYSPFSKMQNINFVTNGIGTIIAQNNLLLFWHENKLIVYDKENPAFLLPLGEHGAKINGARMLNTNSFSVELFPTKPEIFFPSFFPAFSPCMFIENNTLTYYGYNNLQRLWSFIQIPDAELGEHADSVKSKLNQNESELDKVEISVIFGYLSSQHFSSPSTKAVTWSDDGCLKIWELETASCSATLTGHKRAIKNVAYANGFIFSRSLDDELKIWNALTYQCLATIQGKEVVAQKGSIHAYITWDISDFPFKNRLDGKMYHEMRLNPHGGFDTFSVWEQGLELKFSKKRPDLINENEIHVYLENEDIHFLCLKKDQTRSGIILDKELLDLKPCIKKELRNLEQETQKTLPSQDEQLTYYLDKALRSLGFECLQRVLSLSCDTYEGYWPETEQKPEPTGKRFQRRF